MTEMISFGAGVNSVAMTIMLVEQGWRGPLVFSDTGGEHPETYCYLEYFGRWLAKYGLQITILSPATRPDLYDDKRLGGLADTLEEYCLKRGIIPLLAVRWCSVQFKRNPLENWRKQHELTCSVQGMSASEPQRIRFDDPAVRYPLYEEAIHRPECFRIIQRAGLETPIKSGCFFCPGANLAGMRRLYYDHPDLYDRCIALEDNASDRNQKWATLDPHGISYREHAKRRWTGQMQMDLSEWLPCACRL